MGRKLISLNFTPSDELPERAELKAFLETDLHRHLPGFSVLDTAAEWGDCRLDLVGLDTDRGLVVVFASVSRHERDWHEVISQALLATTWLEENREEAAQRYRERGVDLDRAPRMLLVAPAIVKPSRALARALERAGVVIFPYAIFDIQTADGLVKAVSFAMAQPTVKAAPAAAPAPPPPSPPRVETARTGSPRAERDGSRAEAEPYVPAPAPAAVPEPQSTASAPERAEGRRPPALDAFIGSLTDANLKTMSEQILSFLLSRFPNAEGTVSPNDRGFTLTVAYDHLATIRLDRNALWLEVGPEKIPTNKIKDPATLERAMNLPSVLEALRSVQG
jgi:hypothetical protein